MADGEDIQPLVCDNGTGMVKVSLYKFSIYDLFSLSDDQLKKPNMGSL